jgi:hypothetical protein
VSALEPSYEELAALVVELTAHLRQARAQVAALEVEVASLRARLGRDSTSSSSPPSADSPAARGKRKAVRSQRVRSKDRKRDGQPGQAGSGLTPTPDRNVPSGLPRWRRVPAAAAACAMPTWPATRGGRCGTPGFRNS